MAETEAPSEWVAPTGKGRWSRQAGREMVEAWRRSGESRSGFARRHGLGAHRVQYWADRLEDSGDRARSPGRRQPNEEVTFAPVRVVGSATPGASNPVSLEVLIGTAVVRVPPSFDESHLRRLVRALGGGE